MTALLNQIVAGYNMPVGDKDEVVFDHNGPSSYTQVTAATTPTGGDAINASDLGYGGLDYAACPMADSTGNFRAVPIPVAGLNGAAVKSIILMWISLVTATVGGQSQTAGAQAAATTDLSTFQMRVKMRTCNG